MINIFNHKYLKYLITIVFLYAIFIVLKRLINVYSIFIIALLLISLYLYDKKLFKKLVFKIIYKNKKKKIFFKNKFGAAKKNLESISEINNKINDKIKVKLLNYEKRKLETQLKTGDYNVILFGAGSSGKTSIARAILKGIIGKISPTIGTTKDITSYKIRIPILKRNINIIDTPGLFESSKEGVKREKLTILEASNSDLILFVIDQDINKYENYLINEFVKIGKKLIIVLNKCDLRSKKENYLIQENIKSITSSLTNNISVVRVIASPKLSRNVELKNSSSAPDVSPLFKEIIETLHNNGEELLADNILFRSNKLGIKSKNFIKEQRRFSAKKLIDKYMWITGSVVLVNPLPVVDFLTTTSVNVQMIIEISKIYDIKLSKREAINLSKSLVSTIAKIGLVKGGTTIITTTLSSTFTSLFISKSIQSITSGWIIKIVGLSLIEYFENEQNRGEETIQDIVERIYKLNKKEDVLNNFIKEAIAKLEIKKNYKLKNKLPPSD